MPMDVTVIVPVFNLEDYIEKAIRSIQMQHFDGTIEIIIVDDGSNDNSLAVANHIAEKDQRIRVITQKNSGVSAARNAGLDAARGEYVIFVDGDDILRADAVETLINSVKANENAILACGDLMRIGVHDQPLPATGKLPTCEENEQILKRILLEQYSVSSCAKLYIRERIGDLRFVTGRRINEDKYFLIQYLMKNKGTVVDVNDYVYGYYVRPGSASNSTFSEKSLDMIYFSERIYADVCEGKPEMERLARYNAVVAHLAVLKKIIRSGRRTQHKEVFAEVRGQLLQWSEPIPFRQLKAHAWEVFILRYCHFLYAMCVRLVDMLKAVNR